MVHWVIAVILAMASVARGDSRAAMEDYFDGEITGGWTLSAMGTGGLVAGGVLLADGSDRARGASYVAFGFGAAHLVAGVYINVASRVRKRIYGMAIASAPDLWRTGERLRMRGVAKQLLVLQIVEATLLAGGGVLAYVGHANDRPQLEGAGYGLAIEAAATLVFDIFAARRAGRYRARLATDAAGQPFVLLGTTRTF